jgi:hypothetical protein
LGESERLAGMTIRPLLSHLRMFHTSTERQLTQRAVMADDFNGRNQTLALAVD